MVVCGDEVMVMATHNAVALDDFATSIDVATANGVVVVVGAAAAVDVWVQWCLMRPCISPQFAFVLVVVTLMGKELS